MSIYINNPRNKIICFAREAIRAHWNGFPGLGAEPKMTPKSMFFSLFFCMQQMSPILKPRSAPETPGPPKVTKRVAKGAQTRSEKRAKRRKIQKTRKPIILQKPLVFLCFGYSQGVFGEGKSIKRLRCFA